MIDTQGLSTLFAENNEPAERAFLGAALFAPDKLTDISLAVDDFFFQRHGWIWGAMLEVMGRGEVPSEGLVTAELRLRGRIDDVGGSAYLTDLMTQKEAFDDPRAWADVLVNLSARRQLAEYHDYGAVTVLQQDRSIFEVLDEHERDFTEIKQRVFSQREGGLQPVSRALKYDVADSDENWEAYQQRVRQRFKTGIPSLDNKINAQKKEVILFGGRPGEGKSTILQSIVYHNLIAPHIIHEVMDDALHLKIGEKRYIRFPSKEEMAAFPRYAFFSLEMGEEEIVKRWVAMATGISVERQNTGRILRDDFSAIQDTTALIKDWIDDHLLLMCGSMTVERMASEVEAFKPDAAFSDYMQLFRTAQAVSNDVERISVAMKKHKELAMTLDIPVFTAAQVNREGDGEPKLKHLKGSGSLEEDSDTVVLMHLPDQELRPDEMDLLVAKHRNGDTGKVTAGRLRGRTLFVDLTKGK